MANPHMGDSWEAAERELFTPSEIATSNLRVSVIAEIINARNEDGITQRRLGELSGVKQPVIARMESGTSSPNLDTILKVLAPLGKTLYVGDMR
jgi:DNA-binding XRE family transcriptional regulator